MSIWGELKHAVNSEANKPDAIPLDKLIDLAIGKVEAFTRDGSFTVPPHVTVLKIIAAAGGGGGSVAGGAGGECIRKVELVSPGYVYNFTVGKGGKGVDGGQAGNGTDTVIGDIVLKGGKGAQDAKPGLSNGYGAGSGGGGSSNGEHGLYGYGGKGGLKTGGGGGSVGNGGNASADSDIEKNGQFGGGGGGGFSNVVGGGDGGDGVVAFLMGGAM